MSWTSLELARQDAMACERCSLSQGRSSVVWLDGNPRSDLMFIGEAPGFHEDREGRPFVGAAGKLLDAMLGSIGLTRNDCVIVNVLKCRPPNNRDPLPDEIDACRPFLSAQIEFIRPRLIVTLGNFATRFVLGPSLSISRVRGQKFEALGAAVVPTFHPAALLHSGGQSSPAAKLVQSDFQLIRKLLAELPPRVQPEPQQTALF